MSKRTVRPPDRYLHENIEIAIDGKRAEDRKYCMSSCLYTDYYYNYVYAHAHIFMGVRKGGGGVERPPPPPPTPSPKARSPWICSLKYFAQSCEAPPPPPPPPPPIPECCVLPCQCILKALSWLDMLRYLKLLTRRSTQSPGDSL